MLVQVLPHGGLEADAAALVGSVVVTPLPLGVPGVQVSFVGKSTDPVRDGDVPSLDRLRVTLLRVGDCRPVGAVTQ